MSKKTCSAKVCWAGQEHALLTYTSAMDCWSFSLPAKLACPGRVDKTPADICWQCYAQLGAYNYRTVLNAQAARFAWVKYMMRADSRWQEFVNYMVNEITQHVGDDRYFRWHDSGDIFSPDYCEAIAEICWRTPHVKHWLPTRSWRLKWAKQLTLLHRVSNVNVRPSALKINDRPPVIKGLGRGSTVHDSDCDLPPAPICPKTDPTNPAKSCVEAGCRNCWDARRTVSYFQHGRGGFSGGHHATVTESKNRLAVCKDKAAFVPVSVLETMGG